MNEKRAFGWERLLKWICPILLTLLQLLMLDCSMQPMNAVLSRAPLSNLLNLALLAIPVALLTVITGRAAVSLLICGILSAVISVVNCFVYAMHGAPLRLSEIATVGTAADVLGGYRLSVPATLWTVLILLAAWVGVFLLYAWSRRETGTRRAVKNRILAAVCLAATLALAVTGFSAKSLGLRPELGYSWMVSVNKSGYAACLVEDTLQFFSSTVKPDSYSPETAKKAAAGTSGQAQTCEQLPDVILILNETFYDPAVDPTLGLTSDEPWLEAYRNIQGAQEGLALVPTTGTNSSEYELLTGNAKCLVNASAPFNFLNFQEANTLSSYMKSLGYETWAMHGLGGANYARYKVYPEMGFDHVLFQEDFEFSETYGRRYRTDRNDYEQLKNCYMSGGDGPRFLYLLTYQNHGGWEQNDASFDTVHTRNEAGIDPEIMNEYLTGIRMSSDAIADLTAWFSASDRPVLLIMVGDHPPVFLTNRNDSLVRPEDDESMLRYLKQCSTPYLIWSNRSLAEVRHPWITLTDLVPTAFHAAGLPLSGYFSALLRLQEAWPIHAAGTLVDPENRLIRTAEGSMPDEMRDVLILGYNNLQPLNRREQDVFTVSVK